MNVAIAGTGYLGLANALLLAQHHSLVALDVNAEQVAMINARVWPILSQLDTRAGAHGLDSSIVEVINDLDKFKALSGVIAAKRAGEGLVDVARKVYGRDPFGVG